MTDTAIKPAAATKGARAKPAKPAFRPFIPANVILPEFTVLHVLMGAFLGVIFGASSLYLVLKVGLTVSASIPVAVISITLFRLLQRLGIAKASILQNNIVQTAGSAGESIAFGLGVTMPAIMILGFDMEIARVMLVAILGGLLGILMMIPLRRALIVEQHGILKYPEGTACAEVLKAGATREEHEIGQEAGGAQTEAEVARGARTIVAGFGIGLVYKLCEGVFKLWKDTPEKVFAAPLAKASIAAEISPELLGVGYIIGPRIAATMAAGGVLAYMVLIPAIQFFGAAATAIIPPGKTLISAMSPGDIRSAYILYIGAGAVTAGGLISLARAMPTIWRSLKASFGDFGVKSADAVPASELPRTDRDLSMKWVALGVVVLVAGILMAHSLRMNIAGALLIVLFGFLFVTVSSRLTGELGSSSNPISGMTVATLLLTCLIFLLLGWTGPTYYVTALSVGGIVCIAASNGGTTSQDLKTGFLIGSTPRAQQLAIMVGALASAIALGPILLSLNQAATVYVPQPAAAAAITPAAAASLPTEALAGPQHVQDAGVYHVWQKADPSGGAATRYLVRNDGTLAYLVDPGINGHVKVRPDGTSVTKFDAPKATLMSYIIKGILNRQLPWALVLLGVMIAVVLEMCAIPSLAFAVGVYLPVSSSLPIFVGGAVRWLVDRRSRKQSPKTSEGAETLSEAELAAQSDRSPGVLMASGYIAGGAIAGIGIAFSAGVLGNFDRDITKLMEGANPVFNGAWSDLLSCLPFLALMALLFRAGSAKKI
ncbi:OPT family oligopeptide transporter [Phenylobacterium sp.]|uniref:OPT family oligopeptide transporter n=1 Tax=Phenylobacterium sp. TaxID=1871053 RepID=UPI002B886169|nr:oligopeptide transporter, OPT family [Phenylobacterium sp.]HLZ76908.1 oligopeptide transporter, OPT family [Phenylobacterium sp.]